MVRRGQKLACSPPPQSPSFRLKKKESTNTLACFQQLWREIEPSFHQQRLADRAQTLALSSLLCFGRHTITGMLSTSGAAFRDWRAAYRLFSEQRVPINDLFAVIRRAVLTELPPQAPLIVALDDSLLRKSGTHIPGVSWRRDPLGPHFQTNFVLGQRFLQLSASVPLSDRTFRLVPIALCHAPTPTKPSPKAPTEEIQQYRSAARAMRLPLLAAQQIGTLRRQLDDTPGGLQRPLHLFVDGGFVNSTVLKLLPPRTTLVGRIRKDAKLYWLPESSPTPHVGRPRRYGAPAPTPEQIRTDETQPWITLDISISGAPHQMRVKSLGPVLWRTAGLAHVLRIVVIAPLSYRLRKNSKPLYRRPAFLVCTDPAMDLCSIVQGYVQRCDIETNFREEKTLLGVGQAEVRDAHSVEAVPAFQVAAYAMLLLATLRAFRETQKEDRLPAPKWNTNSKAPRFTTARAVNQLRAEMWGKALGITNFSDFVSARSPGTKPEKLLPDLPSAVLYAVN
jgi:DDE superfamily endonuclease